jgi:hypothetical protein
MLLLVFTFGNEQGLYQERILEVTILATRENYPKRTMQPIPVVGVVSSAIEKKNRPLIFVVGVYVSSVLFLAKKDPRVVNNLH